MLLLIIYCTQIINTEKVTKSVEISLSKPKQATNDKVEKNNEYKR